jgi:hypothetical protein
MSAITIFSIIERLQKESTCAVRLQGPLLCSYLLAGRLTDKKIINSRKRVDQGLPIQFSVNGVEPISLMTAQLILNGYRRRTRWVAVKEAVGANTWDADRGLQVTIDGKPAHTLLDQSR